MRRTSLVPGRVVLVAFAAVPTWQNEQLDYKKDVPSGFAAAAAAAAATAAAGHSRKGTEPEGGCADVPPAGCAAGSWRSRMSV